MRSKLVLILAVVILAGGALAASPALAKGPSGGGGKNGGSTAVLTYSPNPVPVNTTFTVTGKGFVPNSWVGVGFAGWITWSYAWADSTGTFNYTYPTTISLCGSYLFEATQNKTIATVYINVTGCN